MQCDNCNSTNQINIAGKDFCANCGTLQGNPQQIAALQTLSSTQNTAQIATNQSAVPSSTPNLTNPSNSSNAIITSPSSAAINPKNNVVSYNNYQNNQPEISAQNPTNSLAVNNQATSLNTHQSTGVNSNLPSQAYQSQPTSKSVQNNVNKPNDLSISQPVVASNSVSTAINTVASTNDSLEATNTAALSRDNNLQTYHQTNPSQINANQSTIDGINNRRNNNELKSLDIKDNSVFSDEQLDELASQDNHLDYSVKNPFNSIKTDTPKKPINDISLPTTAQSSSFDNNLKRDSSLDNNDAENPPVVLPKSRTMPNPVQLQATNNTQDQMITSIDVPSKAQKKTKRKAIGGKVASVGLSLAGIALLGVYVWQINYPNLALKVAGSKAGISVSMPTNLPNGWKISGNVQTSPGAIGYKLTSADGKRAVAINQVKTDWDSQAMAENYLNSKTDTYTALQAQGLTIYLYKGNQASWINHGTWYRIEGTNHGLTQDQIVKMATSL